MPSHHLWVLALTKAFQICNGAAAEGFIKIHSLGKVYTSRTIHQIRINIRCNSSSSARWKTRQGRDFYAREAKVQGLKSRAAFKLLEMDAKYRIFKKGQTVVDLGYAPGSWSQVALERTKPTGRIVGIDIIPAQPPKGVSTIQGNFLSKEVQEEVKRFLSNSDLDRPQIEANPIRESERRNTKEEEIRTESVEDVTLTLYNDKKDKGVAEKTVDVVLSDMSAPWEQTTGFWKKSLSSPYNRMMNTSGINFKDHAGSMDLCAAALDFSKNNLKTGGIFLCKFYQGAEDKQLEAELKRLFFAVYREKPESSRSESKEAYFVALRRKKEP